MILDLHRQGLSVSAISRQTGLVRKTVRRYVDRGLEPPAYQPRPPRANKIAPFEAYLCERVAAYPELTASRLHRELRDLGYGGGYTMVKVFLRGIRPVVSPGFEVLFETPPGRQAQVDFAHFRTVLRLSGMAEQATYVDGGQNPRLDGADCPLRLSSQSMAASS